MMMKGWIYRDVYARMHTHIYKNNTNKHIWYYVYLFYFTLQCLLCEWYIYWQYIIRFIIQQMKTYAHTNKWLYVYIHVYFIFSLDVYLLIINCKSIYQLSFTKILSLICSIVPVVINKLFLIFLAFFHTLILVFTIPETFFSQITS